MQNKQSILQYSMTNGAVLGLILVIFSVIEYVLDIMPVNTRNIILMPAFSFLIMLVFMVISMKNYRNKVLGGYITFGDSFLLGLLIIAFSAIISSFYSLIFNLLIDPGYMDRVVEGITNWTYNLYLSMGLNESQIDEMMQKVNEQMTKMTPLRTFFSGILNSAIFGSIISLIISAFIRKDPPPFAVEDQN
jgi:hypothetical protein